MTNSTQEREAAARARCEAAGKTPWGRHDFTANARTDLPDALDEIKRLREELIGAWTHREYRCPCSEKQRDPDQKPVPWQKCTCGLDEALYAPSL